MNMLPPRPKAIAGLTTSDTVERINGVLYYLWDPLGMPQGQPLEHEYDGYLMELLDLLDTGAEPDRLTECLEAATLDVLGEISPAQQQHAQELAALIYRIYHAQPPGTCVH